MITYKPINKVRVFIDGQSVGYIVEKRDGWIYFPHNSEFSGDAYATLELCKKSLEED